MYTGHEKNSLISKWDREYLNILVTFVPAKEVGLCRGFGTRFNSFCTYFKIQTNWSQTWAWFYLKRTKVFPDYRHSSPFWNQFLPLKTSLVQYFSALGLPVLIFPQINNMSIISIWWACIPCAVICLLTSQDYSVQREKRPPLRLFNALLSWNLILQ